MTKATVKIELPNNGEVELIPSLAAMEYLSKQSENFQAVYAKLSTMNLDMFAHVIKAGLSTNSQAKNTPLSNFREEVYEAGMISLMEPLIRFVTILLNGGKEPSKEEAVEEAKSTDPNP